jgi:hypothetical protein
MKKLVLVLLLTTTLIPFGIAEEFVSSCDSFTKLGKYKIEIAEKPFILNGKELKTYLIRYENGGFTLLIAADKLRDEIKYLTISDALSVQYVSHKTYFGVEKIEQKYSAYALETSETVLNKYEYFRQKAITSWDVTELEKIKLIAAFYPALLKNIDNILAAK